MDPVLEIVHQRVDMGSRNIGIMAEVLGRINAVVLIVAVGLQSAEGDMGIKIWLVVMAAWGTPLTIKQMPGMSSCKAVARAIVEMSGDVEHVRRRTGIGDERG